MDPQTLALFPLWFAAFLLSLTCHEAAHAWVARLGGDDTAYHAGQVSLNPWPHLRREPVGTVLVPLITYFLSPVHWMMGWASAPYDPFWEQRHPRRAAAMSIAGPAANFLLFSIAFVVLRAGLGGGVWVPPAPDQTLLDQLVRPAAGAPAAVEAIGRFLSVVFCLNLILGVFNLIPVPPLDGASVVSGLVSPLRVVYARARAMPAFSLVGILVAWQLAPWLVRPALKLAVAFLYAS